MMKYCSFTFAVFAFVLCLAPERGTSQIPEEWKSVLPTVLQPDTTHQIAFAANNVVFYAASNGIFRSDDGGLNVYPINTGLMRDESIRVIQPGPNGDAFALGTNSIYHSRDGYTWQLADEPLRPYPYSIATCFTYDKAGTCYLGTIGAGVFQWSNATFRWKQVIRPTMIPGVSGMLFDSQGRLLISYDSIYLMKPDFGSIHHSWPLIGNMLRAPWGETIISTQFEVLGLTDTSLRKVAEAYNRVRMIDSNGTLFSDYNRSSDKGLSWQHVPAQEPPSEAGRDVILAYYDQYVLYSNDGWRTQQYLTALDSRFPLTELYVDVHGVIWCSKGYETMWSSIDHGNTWKRSVRRITALPQEDGRFYTFVSIDTLLVSTDRGLTFKPIRIANAKQVIRTSLYASKSGRIYLAYLTGEVVRTSDEGVTWDTLRSFNGPDTNFPFIIHEHSPWCELEYGGRLYIGTSGQLVYSTDDGKTWDSTACMASELYPGFHNTFYVGGTTELRLRVGNEKDHPLEGIYNTTFLPAEDAFRTRLINFNHQFIGRYDPYGILIDTVSMNTPDFDPRYIVVDSSGYFFACGGYVGGNPKLNGIYRLKNANATVIRSEMSACNVTVHDRVIAIQMEAPIERVTVFDLLGRPIAEKSGNGNTTSSISLSGAPAGVYGVQITTAKSVIYRKMPIP